MKIIIKNLQKKIKVNPAKIKKIARKISCPAKSKNLELRLYFVKNSLIRKLNRQFFSKNSFTDVISFNLENDYAEVFIAPSVVKSNAFVFKESINNELYRCVIHGILHVYGFNDLRKTEKARMWRKQESILKKITCN